MSQKRGRERGNGTGSVTKFENQKGQVRYRVRVTVSSYFDEVAMKHRCPLDLESKVETVGDLFDLWVEEYFASSYGKSVSL